MIWLERLGRGASFVMLVSACVVLLLMAFHVTLNVLARYAFGGPIAATVEVGSHYYMVGVTFLPLAYAQFERHHVAVDFVLDAMPARVAAAFDVVADLVMLTFVGLIGYASYVSAVAATDRRDYVLTENFDLLVWPAHWILVVTMAAFTLVVAIQVIQRLTGTAPYVAPNTEAMADPS